MEQEKLIFAIYGKSPIINILDLLMSFPKSKFTATEIVEDLGMSKTIFYKYSKGLLNIGTVSANSEPTGPKRYYINLESPLTQNIRESIDFVSERLADKEAKRIQILPIKIMTRKFKHRRRIADLKKLERQTKTEIKKLEEPINA